MGEENLRLDLVPVLAAGAGSSSLPQFALLQQLGLGEGGGVRGHGSKGGRGDRLQTEAAGATGPEQVVRETRDHRGVIDAEVHVRQAQLESVLSGNPRELAPQERV